jgi:hypothetical protein
MANTSAMSYYFQGELLKRSLQSVAAVEAARWLDRAGLLKDSARRPGLPLRKLLRAGRIAGQRQEPNDRWFIDRVEPTSPAPTEGGKPVAVSSSPTSRVSAAADLPHVKKLTEAREKYRPHAIKYLLVAESPPTEGSGRYFYFEDVSEGDSLFWQTIKTLYPDDCPPSAPPPRHRKREFLERFRADGFFLLDAMEKPLGEASPAMKRRLIRNSLPRLKGDLRAACGTGTKVILISAPVFKVCAAELAAAGFNVVNAEMIDFPGSGGQRKFREKFARALAE